MGDRLYQARLPFARGDRYPNECGHPDKLHYALNMCAACYAHDYREKNLVKRRKAEAKSKAKAYRAAQKRRAA